VPTINIILHTQVPGGRYLLPTVRRTASLPTLINNIPIRIRGTETLSQFLTILYSSAVGSPFCLVGVVEDAHISAVRCFVNILEGLVGVVGVIVPEEACLGEGGDEQR